MERQAKPGEKRNVPRPPGLRVFKTVFWSFFGVRKRRDLEADATQLNPLHVIAAALICAAIFIVLLILIVRAVVG